MKFAEFFQEDNGGFSSTRLIMFLWGVGILVVWIISTTKHDWVIQDIHDSIQVVLGIVMTGKVVQKFGEEKNVPPVQQVAQQQAQQAAQQPTQQAAQQNVQPGT